MSNNAILLCGGIGRRMAPIPRCNKSLLNIKGEMNLHRIVRILNKQGVNDIIVATNPQSAKELITPLSKMSEEFPDVHILIVTAQDYEEGCNNVVTLRAAADYIGNSYIIETDQYYKEEVLEEFIKPSPLSTSYFFTQDRTEEDWAVITTEYNEVKLVLKENPMNRYPCLAGIYYIKEDLAKDLRSNLNEYQGKDIYWEELINIPNPEEGNAIVSWYFPEGYSMEYDNISDLVNKNLMDPQDIANLIDDNHEAQRLGSMTNTTYKVKKDGKYYALRIPGYGTDRFVNHHREKSMEETIPLYLRPDSQYFSNDEVKLSEYLEGYEVLKDFSDLEKVSRALSHIHEDFTLDLGNSSLSIDLMEEIEDYEKIYKGEIPDYEDYEYYRSKVENYLKQWFSKYIHERVHRDLVPLNVMINSEGSVRFIDWEYAGYLSRYWDLASLICEYADEYQYSISEVFSEVKSSYPQFINGNDLLCWIAVVDFVWSVWSLAKRVLGDDVEEYGNHRYNRACAIIDNCMEV